MFRYAPFLFFLACCVVFALALRYQPETASPMIGRQIDMSALPTLEAKSTTAISDDTPRIINLFASWCTPCIGELPYLEQISTQTGVPVIGVAWKDKPQILPQWLKRYGNPFAQILLDQSGEFGITLGIRGLPETYIIDASGRIIHHHSGPITQADVAGFISRMP